jgi:hypothetical protein
MNDGRCAPLTWATDTRSENFGELAIFGKIGKYPLLSSTYIVRMPPGPYARYTVVAGLPSRPGVPAGATHRLWHYYVTGA